MSGKIDKVPYQGYNGGMKKITSCIRSIIVLAVIFSFLQLSIALDVSVLAFPLSLLFTLVYVFIIRRFEASLEKDDGGAFCKYLSIVIRLLQYAPFVYISMFVLRRAGEGGLPYVLDLVTVLLWVAITVLSFVALHFLGEKRLAAFVPASYMAAYKESQKKPPFKGAANIAKRISIEIFEWVDAIVQAVFDIILLNIFLFQLYEIPSESMVPTFLIKDRVAVFKTLAGPKFPLSKVGLPYVQNYKRGDIVVFRNPHYADDHKSEVKTFLSQFIYMVTLTFVKTNTDENGELKADPLVKRVVGEPGEQLMLMDGTLYARTKDSPEFKDVGDASALWDTFSHTDLYDVDKNVLKIQKLPISDIYREEIDGIGRDRHYWQYALKEALAVEQESYADTVAVEQERRALDLSAASRECESLSEQFARYALDEDIAESEVKSLLGAENLFEYDFFHNSNANTIKLLTMSGGRQWFSHFMTDWYKNLGDLSAYTEDGAVTGKHLVGGDLYSDACFRLNVMAKLVVGRLIVRQAALMAEGVSSTEWRNDALLCEQGDKAMRLECYIRQMDQRNMPIFPANATDGTAQYIPEHNYFMMGDNRYNSLDMRHSYSRSLVPLSAYDGYSITYYTQMSPQYVSRSRILGKAGIRFWPFSRIGVVK